MLKLVPRCGGNLLALPNVVLWTKAPFTGLEGCRSRCLSIEVEGPSWDPYSMPMATPAALDLSMLVSSEYNLLPTLASLLDMGKTHPIHLFVPQVSDLDQPYGLDGGLVSLFTLQQVRQHRRGGLAVVRL